MDDDLFQFEPAEEIAPQLVLGKKKKKKKKKDKDAKDKDPAADDSLAAAKSEISEQSASRADDLIDKDASVDNDEVETGDTELTLAASDKKKARKERDRLAKLEKDKQQVNELKDEPEEAQSDSKTRNENDDDDNDLKRPMTAAQKKKAKKECERLAKLEKKKEAEQELDAILAELDGPAPSSADAGPSSQAAADDPLEQQSAPLTVAQKRRLKKKKKVAATTTDDADDIDAIMNDIDEPSKASTSNADTNGKPGAPESAADVDDLLAELDSGETTSSKKNKKKKKKKGGAGGADGDGAGGADDIDALLNELGGSDQKSQSKEEQPEPTTASPSAPGVDDLLAELDLGGPPSKKNKKKKKKKGGGGGEADAGAGGTGDDVDALLAELGGGDQKPQANEPSPSNQAVAAGGDGGVDDLLAELGGGEPSAAGKKKAKKKKKKGAAAKADDEEGADGEEAKAAAAPAEGGKKKKKESAAVRKMREMQEKRMAEEERIRKLKEEEEAKIAAEEKRREEEARKKEEEKARKKAAEKARRERKRQEGTLLSKAERERRRKAEAFKKQLLEKGMIPAAVKSSDSPTKANEKDRRSTSQKKDSASTVADSTHTDKTITEGAKPDAEPGAAEPAPEAEKKEEVTTPPPPAPEPVVPDDWDDDGDVDAEKAEPAVEASAKSPKGDLKPAAKAKAAAKKTDKPIDGENDDNDDDTDDDDESDEDSDDDSDYEGMSAAEVAAEKRLQAFRKKRIKQKQLAMAARTEDKLRSPVICILGHVDTGKTKILDKIRRTNVQDGEAGGITQQIGATYFPIEAVKKEATKLKEGRQLSYNVPSLLIIDTPGHESFTNLRSRGSSLCDIAILVVDIMHGLEPQTRESIDLLKLRKTPFIVALNKIDRIYDWKAQPHNCPSRDSLAKQPRHAQEEFHRRVRETKLEFAEIGFNTELYWDNDDVRRTVSLLPTSAITGEGIPDLLMMLLSLPQRLLTERLMFKSILEATVLEVKVIEGLGTTIDIILTGGVIHEGDTIVVVGLDGPITATIRALLTPHPMKEMRVKGQYLHHKRIEAAQGVKISADGLEKAVAGTQLMVVEDPNNETEVEYALDEVMQDFQTILTNVDKSGLGVYVQASTLGSLEALLEFLRTSKIPVSGINIGPVHKRDVTKASTMLERRKEFATILAFDVIVEREARDLAEETGVRIFTADIIYHLFDQFTAYMEQVKKQRREEVNDDVVFPSISKILPQHVYNKKDPIVVGVDVLEGVLRVGTPLVVKKGATWLDVGRVASIELNKKQVMTARKGESVAVKIQHKSTEHIMYGRHFDFQDALVSKMSRSAIELLKESFRDDLETEDWRLVVKLKTMFDIM